jgi:hypothetical protein
VFPGVFGAASCSPLPPPLLLRGTVDELRCWGHRLETARALADLGHALHGDDRALGNLRLSNWQQSTRTTCDSIAARP